jgi:hypothetical protein
VADPAPTGNLFTYEHVQLPYTMFVINTEFFWEEGLLQIPAATNPTSPPAGCVIVRTSAPYGIKVVRWIARRYAKPPLMPDPNPPAEETNLKLRRFLISPVSESLLADGKTHFYMRQGVYEYLMVRPVAPGEGKYLAGAPPYDRTPLAQTKLAADQFVQGII